MYSPHPNYFEGVLQLRAPSEKLLKFVYSQIESDGRARIAKEKRYKHGIDLYISSQHYLQNLGKKIKERFPGDLKVSTRLHTVNWVNSREVYRITVLFRESRIVKGTKFMIRGQEYEAVVIGKKVQIKNLNSGKKEWKDFEEIEKYIID